MSQALVDATAGRPEILPVYVSLTSNDPSLEVKAFLDERGGMPMLKGAVEAFAAIARLAAWEERHAARLAGEPRRAAWPALVDGRVPWGMDAVLDPLARAAAAPRAEALPERESLERLAAAGLPVTAFRAVAAEPGAAVAAWRELGGGPVAVKLDAPSLAHKSDAGGVVLDLGDRPSIEAAVADLRAAAERAGIAVRGLLVQPMAPAGVELIVGGRRDAVFGPAVLVGLGGILAEVLDDVAVMLAPVSTAEVVAGSRACAAPCCCAAREAPGRSTRARWRPSSRRSATSSSRDPSILEIDLNPVIASPGGVVAVDALVVLADDA